VKPKKQNVSEFDAVISIKLTSAQHDALKALAASEQRTVSQQVRHLVATAIEHDQSAVTP
jgi:hypothetical protein